VEKPGVAPRAQLADQVARLEREAQALARVAHPNVVMVFDVGEVESRAFVAMEYVDGPTMAAWLKQARPSWREVLDAYVQAARGLAAVHAAGLVHRDFKPQNVLLASDGRVRVTDFGLADFEQPKEAAVLREPEPDRPPGAAAPKGPRMTVGTPLYMAPEQYLGKDVDARADQYSFSVALHEALYGRRPFGPTNMYALFQAKLNGPAPAPPPASDVPPFVYLALARGLAPRPRDRFPSMQAMLDALAPRPHRLQGGPRVVPQDPGDAQITGQLGLVTILALCPAAPGMSLLEHANEIAAAYGVQVTESADDEREPDGEESPGIVPTVCLASLINRGSPVDQLALAAKLALRLAAAMQPIAVTVGTGRSPLGPDRGPPAEAIAWNVDWVRRLTRQGDPASSPAGEYAFRHALMHDVAYSALSPADRAAAHLQVGPWLESLGPADPTVLAAHFELGGAPERALPYYQHAADQALRAGFLDTACGLADRGLACGALGKARGELARTLTVAHMWRGDFPRASQWLAQAETHLEPGDPSWFTMMTHRLLISGLMGHSSEVELVVRTLSKTSHRPDLGLDHARASHMAAVVLYYLGLPRLADGTIENFVHLQSHLREKDLETAGRLQLSLFFQRQVRRHQPAAALEAISEACQVFEKVGARRTGLWARIYLGHHLLACGQLTEARRPLNEAWQESVNQGSGMVEPVACHFAALASWHGGDRPGAEAMIVRNLEKLADRVPIFAAHGRADLALLLVEAGDAQAALIEADQALRLGSGANTLRAQGLIARAAASLMLDRPAEALAACEEAQSIASQVGILWLYVPWMELMHARAAQALGHVERAQTIRRQARERLLAWAGEFRSTNARRAFLEDVPVHARVLAEPG
jgi:tetratricopeptide (TPR) repeat protein